MDILGFIDFGNKTLSIDSSLFNSKLLIFTLSGQMALRSSWGSRPDFALSIGGFHPRFNPPPAFPKLQRLTISLKKENVTISLASYLALTTNSLQFGSQLDLYAKWSQIIVKGKLGFDTLFIFSPFSFSIDLYGMISITAFGVGFGINLFLCINGPNPLNVAGFAEFEFGPWSYEVEFNKTFGHKVNEEALPIVSPLEALIEALESPNIFRSEFSPDFETHIIFVDSSDNLLDPSGDLVISQNLVPFDTEMEIFYDGKPPDNQEKLIMEIHGYDANDVDDVETHFSPAQFFRMTNSQKISAPPFEKLPSGKRLHPNYITGKFYRETFDYDTTLYESDGFQTNEINVYDFNTNLSGELYAAVVRNWTLVNSNSVSNRLNIKEISSNPNYIELSDPKFTITTQNAENGKFVNVTGPENLSIGNITFSEAFSKMKKDNNMDHMIRIAYPNNGIEG
jgi:hypothetical protein